MTSATVVERTAAPGFTNRGLFIGLLLFLCAPLGIYKLWRRQARAWLIGAYALVGAPVFLVSYAFFGVLAFAAFLPAVDMSVGDRPDRTVFFKAGNYESTFIETARDTNGAYEFIRVQIQPNGGNEFHYHKNFEETFTAVEGELTVFVGDKTVVLKPGESVVALRNTLHTFKNQTDKMVTMTVRVEPARGLEKAIRVVYGMSNSGKWDGAGRMKNIWRMALILAYSETYLPGTPPIIQEPLVNALARIAQWKGIDEDFKEFFL